MLAIYNQGVVRQIANMLGTCLPSEGFYRAYINHAQRNLQITDGKHTYYNGVCRPEVTKLLNKLLNREI